MLIKEKKTIAKIGLVISLGLTMVACTKITDVKVTEHTFKKEVRTVAKVVYETERDRQNSSMWESDAISRVKDNDLDVTVTYYDEDGSQITYEHYPSLKQAIKEVKGKGATLEKKETKGKRLIAKTKSNAELIYDYETADVKTEIPYPLKDDNTYDLSAAKRLVGKYERKWEWNKQSSDKSGKLIYNYSYDKKEYTSKLDVDGKNTKSEWTTRNVNDDVTLSVTKDGKIK